MPVLAIKAPKFLRDEVSVFFDQQVKDMLGSIEENPHISIAIIDYDPCDKELEAELTHSLQRIFDKYCDQLELITLKSPRVINELYFGMPVAEGSNAILENIYNDILQIINELNKKPLVEIEVESKKSKDKISIRPFKPFQAHLIFYGPLAEKLNYPDNQKFSSGHFVPTEILLRDNKPIKVFTLSKKLVNSCENEFKQAMENYTNLTSGNNNLDEYLELKSKFNALDAKYKLMDMPFQRIFCLIKKAQLTELAWISRHGVPSEPAEHKFFANVNYAHRLEQLPHTSELLKILSKLSAEELNGFPQKEFENLRLFLNDELKFIYAIKTDRKYLGVLESEKFNLKDLEENILTRLAMLRAEKPKASCIIM